MIQMVNALFLKIVAMSMTAGIVILVVLLVRLLIRRLPKRFAYALWLVVAFRLVVPVTANSNISIFHMVTVGSIGSEVAGEKEDVAGGAETTGGNVDGADGHIMRENVQKDIVDDAVNIKADIEADVETDIETDIKAGDGIKAGIKAHAENVKDILSVGTDAVVERFLGKNSGTDSLVSALAVIWLAGILTLVSYTAIAQMRLRRRIQYRVRLYGNVYECDNIRSPFVLGIVSPKIYLPFRLNETEQQCILAHERYHIRRRDYLVKNAAYLLAIVYWFHPLVWAAYRLMCVDMEMSCDEEVIATFTADLRKEYSRLLLAFAANKRQLSASPLAFGEEQIVKRVKNILNYKKTPRWKLIGGAAVLVITMAACATDASTDEALAPVPDNASAGETVDKTDIVNNTDIAHRTDMSVNSNIASAEEDDTASGQHFIEHREAQWAENSMFDMEFYSLDYADSDRIVFHISSGLFVYDLNSQKIIGSIDLKALNCQAVQTGGECQVAVYRNDKNQLRAAIKPYPYSDKGSYIYDLESDELSVYDTALLEQYDLFDGLVSKDGPVASGIMRTWRAAGDVLPLDDGTYGALYWGPGGPELANMSYEAGDQKWTVFQKEQATLPRLERQDDSFYQSFSLYSGKNINQCLIDYAAFYNRHDYDGVYALSTGLEYSDELRQEFAGRTDSLSVGREVSHSEDEKEYLLEYMMRSDESDGTEQKVYLKAKYIEGEGWRVEGLPTAEP